jgi:predicted peroxiredoxin
MTPALTQIINLSISSSTFPKIWKYAKLIPLLKSFTADPLLPKSCRPVALLLSKVLGKIVFSQLVQYLGENHLIHPDLYGSRSVHNTSTALIQLYDKWADEIEDGKIVGVLVCDQSAAFDLCDHYLLVEKHKLMGLEESAISYNSSQQPGQLVVSRAEVGPRRSCWTS